MASENMLIKIIRYLFFLFNLIIWILGIAIFGVGIYSRIEGNVYKGLVSMDTMTTAANLLIAAGLFVAIIGFLGCCGAIKKWQWMLVGYSATVLLILILEIASVAYSSTKFHKIEKKLTDAVKKGINKNYGKTDKASVAMSMAINLFQQQVGCCGAAGPTDWKNSFWFKNNNTANTPVPTSCCVKDVPKCNVGVDANSTTIYHKGCIAAGKAYAESNMQKMINIAVGIVVIEILGIIFAMLMCNNFRKEEKGEHGNLVNH